MNRISILGISASGKTHFSRILAEKTKLPLHHMDKLYWREGWSVVPEQEWLSNERRILEQDKWIIEGYINAKYPERLHQSDLIIFLDYGRFHCFKNACKRWWKNRKHKRPELPNGCLDTLNLSFFLTIILRKERHEILNTLATVSNTDIIVFTKPKQAYKWLQKL